MNFFVCWAGIYAAVRSSKDKRDMREAYAALVKCHPRLSGYDKLVVLEYLDHCNNGHRAGTAWPKRSTVANALTISVRQVRRSLAKAEAENLLVRKEPRDDDNKPTDVAFNWELVSGEPKVIDLASRRRGQQRPRLGTLSPSD